MLVSSVLSLLSTTLASAACTFGSYQCSGQALQQCDGTGNWYTLQTCSSGTYCSASGYVGCSNSPPASSSAKTSTTTTTTTTKPTVTSTGKTSTKPTTTTNGSTKSTTTTTTTTTTGAPTSTLVPTTTGSGSGPAQGGACSPFGSVGCANGVQYQCVYDPKGNGNLVWNQWGTCSGGGGGPTATTSGTGPTGTYRPFTTPGVIGYWTNWSPYSRSENSIDKLDLTGFTAINYAFLNTDANGGLVSFDPIKDAEWIPKFNAVKSKYPNLRTIVSIGGWSGSRTFSTIAKSATLIQTFATNILNFLSTNGFDGVDIDWEYPGGNGVTCNAVDPMDAKNFVDMLAALRAKLGPTRSISIAGSAETSRYVINGTNYIPEYMKYINYAQVMSYDFYGSWVSHSDFNSPLDVPGASDPQEPAGNNNGYTTPMTQKSSIGLWLAAGASASQLTNGLAFYGRSWSVQSNANNGLYQLCTGSVNGAACDGIVGDFLDNKNNGPAGTWCDPCNVCYYSGVWMYNNLRGQALAAYGAQPAAPLASGPLTASNGWNRQYFAFAQNPTLYTANYNGKSSFIAYDDPTSIQAKAAWAKSAGLGGTMIWELSQDYNKELVNAVRAGWGA